MTTGDVIAYAHALTHALAVTVAALSAALAPSSSLPLHQLRNVAQLAYIDGVVGVVLETP